MFIVLGVAWVCALGPGVVRRLAERGLTLRSPRHAGRARYGSNPFAGVAGVVGALGQLRRNRRRPSLVAAPRVRLSPAARRTRKRRRELLAGLSGVAFGSLLLGFVPGLRMLLVLSAVSTVLLSVYVVALVRLKATASAPAITGARRPAYEYAYTRASGE